MYKVDGVPFQHVNNTNNHVDVYKQDVEICILCWFNTVWNTFYMKDTIRGRVTSNRSVLITMSARCDDNPTRPFDKQTSKGIKKWHWSDFFNVKSAVPNIMNNHYSKCVTAGYKEICGNLLLPRTTSAKANIHVCMDINEYMWAV